jgi:hypothetical protein
MTKRAAALQKMKHTHRFLQKHYIEECRRKKINRATIWNKNHKKRRRQLTAAYQLTHKDKIRQYMAEYQKKRYHNDPEFREKVLKRSRLWQQRHRFLQIIGKTDETSGGKKED